MKKAFDAAVFKRKRRERLLRAWAGLTAEPIQERVREAPKNDSLWKQCFPTPSPSASKTNPRKTGGPSWHHPSKGPPHIKTLAGNYASREDSEPLRRINSVCTQSFAKLLLISHGRARRDHNTETIHGCQPRRLRIMKKPRNRHNRSPHTQGNHRLRCHQPVPLPVGGCLSPFHNLSSMTTRYSIILPRNAGDSPRHSAMCQFNKHVPPWSRKG
jgi:hypothetical protein